MIDITKPTRTRSGLKVVGLQYKPANDAGAVVTYPIKGSIIRKGREPEYQIWSEDGKYDVVLGRRPDLDLVQDGSAPVKSTI